MDDSFPSSAIGFFFSFYSTSYAYYDTPRVWRFIGLVHPHDGFGVWSHVYVNSYSGDVSTWTGMR